MLTPSLNRPYTQGRMIFSLLKRVGLGAAFLIVLVGVLLVDKGTIPFFPSQVSQGEVAGASLPGKFLDASIADVLPAFAQVSSPYQDISGNVAISGQVQVNGNPTAQLKLNDPTAGTDAKIKFVRSSAGGISLGRYNDAQSSSAQQLTIDNSGLVGIGTANPSSKLQVNDGIVSTDLGADNYPGTGVDFTRMGFYTTGGYGIFQAYKRGTGYRPISIEGNPVYFVAGPVGIGTAVPGNLLQINSGAAPSSSQFKITANNAGSLSALAYTADNISLGFDVDYATNLWTARNTSAGLFYKSGGQFIWYGNTGLTPGQAFGPTARMVLDLGTGNLGIGTVNPLSKLSVGGDGVSTAGIYVNGGTGYGVYGQSSGGTGVFGTAGNGTGVFGSGGSAGVYGSSATIGVRGSGGTYNFYASGAGIDYGTASSIRWKHNIRPINNALEKVLNLNGVYYDWNADHGGKPDMGMIAEDVGKYVPEIVSWDPDAPGYATGMDYGHLTPILVEAIKEQQKQITSLLNIVDIVNKIGHFTQIIVDKIQASLIETQKLIVGGVDILEELTSLKAENASLKVRLDSLESHLKALEAKQ